MTVAEKVAAMRESIESHPDAMRESAFIVVTRNRGRIRLEENSERSDV